MSAIPFTQYLRPDGRKRTTEIERPAEVQGMAAELFQAGYRFEIEELTTGQICMTCARPDDDPVAMELCENGPAVPEAVDRLVRSATIAKAQGEP